MKEHFLTLLRDQRTDTEGFRRAASTLASLIAQEIGSQVELEVCAVRTPVGEAAGAHLTQKVILVPILRAGLALLPPFLQIFPGASIGFLGVCRDEKTAKPRLYYENIPGIGPHDLVFLLDPMLATGGTAKLALQKLEEKGASPSMTVLVNFVAAKAGLQAIREHHPLVKIHAAAIDDRLNDKKFIVPGLGDFGNRYFGA